jgi:hypothetical protein
MPGFGATAAVWRPGEHLPSAHSRPRTRTRDLPARHGIDCPTVTGAFEFESASGVYTELQYLVTLAVGRCGGWAFN